MSQALWLYLLCMQLLIVEIATCTSLTQSYARSDDLGTQMQLLMSAQSKREVISNLRTFQKVQRIRHLCTQELKEKRVPFGCFELLDLEKRLRLISIQKWRDFYRWLDEICLSTLMLQESVVQGPDQSIQLGPRCKAQLGKSRATERYRNTEEDAVLLFSSRLDPP